MQSNQVNANTGHRFICKTPDITPGLILHPSLGCSALVGTDSTLIMLIMGNSGKPITPEKINVHLKILSWSSEIGNIKHKMLIGEGYTGSSTPLFGNRYEARNNIKCKKIDLSDIIEDSEGKFAFIPESKTIQAYKDQGYTDLYRVEINIASIANEGGYNLFWINQNKEHEDEIIQQRLDGYFGTRICKYLHNGKLFWHGFAVNSSSLFFDKLQQQFPICSYHPVLYKRKPFFNIAFLSDLHIAARQELLRRSQAKVIETDDIAEIGSLLNSSFENIRDMLSQAGSDPDVDIILMGGDTVDFQKSFYPVDFLGRSNQAIDLDHYYDTPGKIWAAVGVDNRAEANMKYQDCVDMITFFSLILNQYESYGKPVFFVTGNHDAYYNPYGISPRVTIAGIELKRANEGVPADMNLTIYEAIMLYGKEYNEITEFSIFKKERLEAFYSLFTPMKDYALILPDFALTALSWGEDEDVIDFLDKIPILGPLLFLGSDDQGMGHLPRAEEAVSDDQMRIVDFAMGKNKKNIFLSHFTFASYQEEKKLLNAEEAHIQFDIGWSATKYDMGTFEVNRKKMYEQYLGIEKKLHYVFTGHSHRRGLYEITGIDYTGKNTAVMRFHSFSYYNQINGPRVIVTDSAGPLPRFNYFGEFKEWGSTTPTFTKAIFQNDGNLSNLMAVNTRNTRAKARFAVALDYIYILENINFIDSCESQEISKRDYMRATSFTFTLKLEEKLKRGLASDLGVFNISEMSVYYYSNGSFQKVPVQCSRRSENTIECRINFPNIQSAERFKTYACDSDNRTVFASVKFSPITGPAFAHYDYSSPYNFEIEIKKHGTGLFGLGNNNYLTIERSRGHNEVPDLDWRVHNYSQKYGL